MGIGERALLSGDNGSDNDHFRLTAAGTPLLDRGLPVAFLQGSQHDRGDEFLLPEVIELDYDVLLVAGEDRAETKLQVLNLGTLRIRCSNTHRYSYDSKLPNQSRMGLFYVPEAVP